MQNKINVPSKSFHSLNEDLAAQYFSIKEDEKFGWAFLSKKCLELMSKHQNDEHWYLSNDFNEYRMGEG